MALDDHTVEIVADKATKLTSIASGCMLTILTFGVQNVIASVRKPGSLAIVKSHLVKKKLPLRAFELTKHAHALLVLLAPRRNRTLKGELHRFRCHRSSSGRGSIKTSFAPRVAPLRKRERVGFAADRGCPSLWAAPPLSCD